MDTEALRSRVDEHVVRHRLIERGGDVTCLVSGGADSTCLFHVLTNLGYRVSALHVAHGLRGDESAEDARFCVEQFGATVIEAPGAGRSEAELRELRYSLSTGRLRATGHTCSDQVETILFRLVSSGTATGIRVRRDDGIVRPLLTVWRDETEAYCGLEGLLFRVDSSNRETKRGLIREEILPLLRRLHPAADANLLAALEEHRELPKPVERALADLLASSDGSRRIDLGGGRTAVREYRNVWVERSPARLTRPVRWGRWLIEPRVSGLVVRGWRAGDRLGAGGMKVQDLFVRAKIPRSERDSWPLVVKGNRVVLVPGVASASGYEGTVVVTEDADDASG